jgi:hypothetical protein
VQLMKFFNDFFCSCRLLGICDLDVVVRKQTSVQNKLRAFANRPTGSN